MNESKIEVLEPEVVKKEVALVATKTGMEQSAALVIKEKFKPYYMEIIKWRSQAAGIGDPADPDQQKKAREVRLALRKARCDVENTRKQEKDGYLKAGQFIDGIARILKQECEPIEAKLEDVEKYAERIEAERKAKLAEARTKQLLDVDPECDPYSMNLADMEEGTYNAVFSGIVKVRAEKNVEAERIEAERIEAERKEAEERERIRKENERLKAEAAAREAELAKERERIAEERRKEQAERDAEAARIETERKAERERLAVAEREAAAIKRKEQERIDAERKAEEARLAEEREEAEAAAKRPDQNKLMMLATVIEELNVPPMSTDAGKAIAAKIEASLAKFVKWVRDNAEELS
jgi:hypothetical protein